MPRPFLSARWSNLAIISYAVPQEMLRPYLPAGPGGATLELDTNLPTICAAPSPATRGGGRGGQVEAQRQPGGGASPSAYVSLVAFQFEHTRVFGIPWPGHTDFPELNLRFYVRCGQIRGVVFIREFVPKPLIAWAAKKFYNEPYLAAPMTAKITQDTRTITAEYNIQFPTVRGSGSPSQMGARAGGSANDAVPAASRAGSPIAATHSLRLTAQKPVTRPNSNTQEHWFKEHSWGFGQSAPRKQGQAPSGLAYEVIHPTWGIYPVQSYELNLDFATLYGPDWGFLSGTQPISVLLAAGSEVAVFPAREEMNVRWGVRAANK